MDWFEKAEDELCEQLNNGEIDQREFNREMRDLRDEYRQGAEDAAHDAYDNYMR